MKKLFIFDLDNTLTESRTRIDEEMALAFCNLLSLGEVAAISGATFAQFDTQLIRGLFCSEKFSRLSILPTSGAEFWTYEKGEWRRAYQLLMPEDIRKKIIATIAAQAGVAKSDVADFIDDRGTQVTYSALGIDCADMGKKKAYDPLEKKRRDFVRKIAPDFPELSFRIGGTTSIDVTMRGVDKAFGIKKLLEYKKVAAADAVFVGDALFEGGNDEAAKASGVAVIETSGPQETKKIISRFLKQ